MVVEQETCAGLTAVSSGREIAECIVVPASAGSRRRNALGLHSHNGNQEKWFCDQRAG
jgi:hypothetical protein